MNQFMCNEVTDVFFIVPVLFQMIPGIEDTGPSITTIAEPYCGPSVQHRHLLVGNYPPYNVTGFKAHGEAPFFVNFSYPGFNSVKVDFLN